MGRTKKTYTINEDQRLFDAIREAGKVRTTVLNPTTNEELQDIIDDKDVQILNLRHQLIGYQAVISYLETQLGLKKSQ